MVGASCRFLDRRMKLGSMKLVRLVPYGGIRVTPKRIMLRRAGSMISPLGSVTWVYKG